MPIVAKDFGFRTISVSFPNAQIIRASSGFLAGAQMACQTRADHPAGGSTFITEMFAINAALYQKRAAGRCQFIEAAIALAFSICLYSNLTRPFLRRHFTSPRILSISRLE